MFLYSLVIVFTWKVVDLLELRSYFCKFLWSSEYLDWEVSLNFKTELYIIIKSSKYSCTQIRTLRIICLKPFMDIVNI